jgi:hypothetical protein
MNMAMVGLVLSGVISSLLLPKRPRRYTAWKNIKMILEWVFSSFSKHRPVSAPFLVLMPPDPSFARKIYGFLVTPKAPLVLSNKSPRQPVLRLPALCYNGKDMEKKTISPTSQRRAIECRMPSLYSFRFQPALSWRLTRLIFLLLIVSAFSAGFIPRRDWLSVEIAGVQRKLQSIAKNQELEQMMLYLQSDQSLEEQARPTI